MQRVYFKAYIYINVNLYNIFANKNTKEVGGSKAVVGKGNYYRW